MTEGGVAHGHVYECELKFAQCDKHVEEQNINQKIKSKESYRAEKCYGYSNLIIMERLFCLVLLKSTTVCEVLARRHLDIKNGKTLMV